MAYVIENPIQSKEQSKMNLINILAVMKQAVPWQWKSRDNLPLSWFLPIFFIFHGGLCELRGPQMPGADGRLQRQTDKATIHAVVDKHQKNHNEQTYFILSFLVPTS